MFLSSRVQFNRLASLRSISYYAPFTLKLINNFFYRPKSSCACYGVRAYCILTRTNGARVPSYALLSRAFQARTDNSVRDCLSVFFFFCFDFSLDNNVLNLVNCLFFSLFFFRFISRNADERRALCTRYDKIFDDQGTFFFFFLHLVLITFESSAEINRFMYTSYSR